VRRVAVAMSKNRTGYCCRISDEVPVPCNWVKDGICGADACKCELKVGKG
jgi:hypothetical protein